MDIDNLTVERIEGLAESFLKSVKDENTLEKNKWTSRYPTYSVSKILMTAYTRVVAKSCPSVNINCVCPGPVKTDLNFNTGSLTVSEGAEGPVMVALAEGGITGQFYNQTQISTFQIITLINQVVTVMFETFVILYNFIQIEIIYECN